MKYSVVRGGSYLNIIRCLHTPRLDGHRAMDRRRYRRYCGFRLIMRRVGK